MKRSEHLHVVAVLFVLFQTFSARRISFSVVTLWLSTMVKLLIAIPARGCIVFVKRLRLSIVSSRGFKYDNENNTLCSISYELTDNSYVFNCSDESVSVLANWKIGTYGFAKDKFPLIVCFHKFKYDNIGGSLQYDVVKQQQKFTF